MDKQSFVVLGKLTTHCVNMGGASIHLQKYFIDKLRLHSVTAQIRLPPLAIIAQPHYTKWEYLEKKQNRKISMQSQFF
jgi:hypothetical protein